MVTFCSHPEFAQLLNLTISSCILQEMGLGQFFHCHCVFVFFILSLGLWWSSQQKLCYLCPETGHHQYFWWYSAAPVLTCNSMWLSVTGPWPKLVLAVKITWLGCMQRSCDHNAPLVTVSNIFFRDAHSQAERKNCIFLSLAVWSALWFQIASSYILLFYLGHREQLVDQLETCILTVSRPIYLHIYLCFYMHSVFHYEWNLSLRTLCAFSSNMILKS